MARHNCDTWAALPGYVRQVRRLRDQVLEPALAVRQARAAAGLQGAEHPNVAPRVRFAQVTAGVR